MISDIYKIASGTEDKMTAMRKIAIILRNGGKDFQSWKADNTIWNFHFIVPIRPDSEHRLQRHQFAGALELILAENPIDMLWADGLDKERWNIWRMIDEYRRLGREEPAKRLERTFWVGLPSAWTCPGPAFGFVWHGPNGDVLLPRGDERMVIES